MIATDETVCDLGVAHVRAAAARLRGEIVRTPTLRVPTLDAMAGCELWLKAESLQLTGAFKARGAMHAVGRLDPAARTRPIITFSSGNHAQAVAFAAKRYGARAIIAMPTDAPAVKVAGVRALGAEIVFAGTTSSERKAAALEIAASTGGVIVPPFDDPHIIAGAGTATWELLEDVVANTGAPLDAVLIPVGGGGLLAGACLACIGTSTMVYSVEPIGCDALAQSLEAGKRVDVEPGPSLADGLRPVGVGELNFAIAQRWVRGSYRVNDDEITRALVALLVHGKLLVEPSGAAALAAALRGGLPGAPRRVGVLLSGGNVEPSLVTRLLQKANP